MKFTDYPKQEDVQQFEIGDMNASVVRLTDENRPGMLKMVMSMYLGDECMYCHKTFTEEQLHTAVVAEPNDFGRIVHKECWAANH